MDRPPHIDWTIDIEEMREAHHVSTQLQLLGQFEAQFLSAEGLMAHSEGLIGYLKIVGQPIAARAAVAEWSMIAAQQAVLAIYHFRAALFSVRDNVRRAPKLSEKVAAKDLEEAINSFEREFPHCKQMRDHVGHYVDKIYTRDKVDVQRPSEGGFVHGVLEGRRLVFTAQRERIQQDITLGEAEKLRSIKLSIYAVFAPAAVRQ